MDIATGTTDNTLVFQDKPVGICLALTAVIRIKRLTIVGLTC
jgi:hypothetical protein